jgi:hypothetical protein
MNLRTYLEEYLETLQEILREDDSEVPKKIESLWGEDDPRRLVFWQPGTRFGHLSTEDARGSELGPLTNQMPAGYRAHVEKYIAETTDILQACSTQDEQADAQLEDELNRRWGIKAPGSLILQWFRRMNNS